MTHVHTRRGAFAHYLEEEGLATTQISLVRPHTE